MVKIPWWLIVIAIVLVVSAITGLILRYFNYDILPTVANLALILTLVVILFYTYFTYSLAQEPLLPVASCWLKADKDSPYEITFMMKNYSKVPIACWTNLNATIEGEAVSLGGFYSGESPFYLQPFGIGEGHFNIISMLDKVGRSLDQMKAEAPLKQNPKEQLYLKIDFWYARSGEKKHFIHSNLLPYYFDFSREITITDF